MLLAGALEGIPVVGAAVWELPPACCAAALWELPPAWGAAVALESPPALTGGAPFAAVGVGVPLGGCVAVVGLEVEVFGGGGWTASGG